MNATKITKGATLFLVDNSRIKSTKNGNGIYKSIIDEETVYVPDAEIDGAGTYIPYHAIATANFVDEKTSSVITDDVCNEEGGAYTGEVLFTVTNNHEDNATIRLFNEAEETIWSTTLATGDTVTHNGTGGNSLVIISLGEVEATGATLIHTEQNIKMYSLNSPTANFIIKVGQQ